MSLSDQQAFFVSIHPFGRLSAFQLEKVLESADIVYYPKGTVLIEENSPCEKLYIIIKGIVQEFENNELSGVYQNLDTFDAQALIRGRGISRFVVDEELICYELPRELFLELIRSNDAFKSYFLEDIAARLVHLQEQERSSELSSFMIGRIKDVYLHKPCIVHASTPIITAIRQMQEQGAGCILVKMPRGMGIVTDTNLRQSVLLGGCDQNSPIDTIASAPLVTIEAHDFLFNALLLMTQHTIKRLAVTENGEVVGILEQMDVMSYFSNHSHLVAIQIEKALSLDDLKTASRGVIDTVRALHAKGVKARYIGRLVSELNKKIYRKLFTLLCPAELVRNSALLIMGSEGRGEQILRTDQDNCLILKDGYLSENIAELMDSFTAALESFGYPRCPGNTMVSNPFWCRELKGYKQQIDQWIDAPLNESFLQMAIFLDASCVSGECTLLDEAKTYLLERFEGQPELIGHFAKAVLAFETPLGIFTDFIVGKTVHRNELDIKKGGIFPIVHGVRSLALQYKIPQTNTFERIKALNNMGVIDRTMATELIEAYEALSSLRLSSMLKKIARGKEPDNYINPEMLSKLERDLLKDSLRITSRFKKFLTYHFKLNLVS